MTVKKSKGDSFARDRLVTEFHVDAGERHLMTVEKSKENWNEWCGKMTSHLRLALESRPVASPMLVEYVSVVWPQYF